MTSTVRIAGIAFATTATLILFSAIGVAWLTAQGGSETLRLPYRLLCHGIESRSFVVAGAPMPICGRCTGIYIGMIGGIAVGFALASRGRVVPGLVAAALVVPLVFDGTTQALGLRESGNLLRFATGLLAGVGLVWIVTRLEADARATIRDRESGLQC